MHALTVALLGTTFCLYFSGVWRLWRKAGRGKGITWGNAACFLGGWLVVAIALLSELHHYAEELLWAHMVQHELLMVLAAPLLVLSRPFEAWAWALPRPWLGALSIRKYFSDGLFAFALHAAAVWLWHVPGLFERAVTNEWLHLAQHASFFITAAIFWWTVVAPGSRQLGAVLSLLGTMMHTGALGALMTFSSRPWYAGYGLEDQQLAGLVMWVPAGLAYPLAALVIMARFLRPAAASRRPVP